MAWLTKSRFLAGLQCEKRLWFEVNQPLEKAPEATLPMLNGRAFDLAVQQLEPGTVISRSAGMPAAIAETRKLLQSGGAPVIHQPAFRSGDLAVIADILRKRGSGYQLIEVKSTTSVKPEHIPDVAFQTLVLRGAKISVESVFIGYVDNTFVLQRPDELAGLKVEEIVTAAVDARLPEIADRAASFLEVMAYPDAPDIPMGAQCTAPYDCPFIGRCTRELGYEVEYPLDILPRSGRKVAQLRALGYEDLRLVPAGLLQGENQQRIHAVTVSGVPYFNPDAARTLKGVAYPKAYLDFETMSFAVPQIVGTSPYEQLPFQFSLHVEDAPGQVRHIGFLEIESFGDFARIANALVTALPSTGPIYVYNAALEAGVIRRLAERRPEYRDRLQGILRRLMDLLPITREAYYHPAMKGSWSIKDVVPTIDSTLAYGNLGRIAAGEAAQLAFLECREAATTPARRDELLKGLETYCERDTWAMVVLRRFLTEESR